MADIQAFKALRYDLEKAGKIEDLTCPPYDIISEEQREEFLARNPRNVIRLELPKGEDPYGEAARTLNQWMEEGILKTDMDPGLYIYEQEFLTQVDKGETRRLRGLICRVKLEEFAAGVVLPHEETLSKAKEDRFRLMDATHCNFSQIYSLYQDPGHMTRQRLDSLTETCAPRYAFSDGLVTHRLWVVNDTVAIAAIQEDFAGRKLYIADGHHRYETALNYRRHLKEQGIACPGADSVMMMLAVMADQGLVEAVVILPAEVDLAGVDGVFQHAQHLGGGPAAGVAGGQLPADGVDGFPRQEQGEGLLYLDGLVRIHL